MTWWDGAVGRRAAITRAFTPADLAGYAELVDDALGEGVPEPLIAGMFSTLLGTSLPGNGTMYLKQRMDFHGPVRADETVLAEVVVTAVRPEKALVDLRTVASVGDRVVCEGEALVMARQHPHEGDGA